MPWGMSECAYNVVDRHGTYQYRAFGVPGLGLRRGLGDDLVVAPYATALAAMVEPAAAVENLRRLGAEGLTGPTATTMPSTTRRATSIPRTARRSAGSAGGRPASSFAPSMAHHQGMALVSIANALLGHPMVERFHADPRIKATELLLQERIPRHAPVTQPRPLEATRVVDPDGRRRGTPLPLAGDQVSARRHSCRTATTSPIVTNAAGASASAAAAP